MLWDPNGNLVQMYLGHNVMQYLTHPDDRSAFARVLGKEAPRPGQLLAQGYERFQKEWKENGIYLPPFDGYENNRLLPNDVMIYYGIERRQFNIGSREHIDNIAHHLYNKASDYSAFPKQRKELQQAIASVATDVPTGNSISQLETFSRTFFWAKAQDYDQEAAISLGYAGNFAFKNLDFTDATSFLFKAFQLSLRTNTIDAETRAAIANDAGTGLRIHGIESWKRGDQQGALTAFEISKQCYTQAIQLAKASGDNGRLFFAICGCAGTCLALNEPLQAEQLLVKAEAITADVNVKYDISLVLRHIGKIQINQLLQQNQELKDRLQEALNTIEKNKFINRLSDIALPLVFHATMSLLYAGGGLLGKNITLSGTTINGPSVIGYNNLQKISNWVV